MNYQRTYASMTDAELEALFYAAVPSMNQISDLYGNMRNVDFGALERAKYAQQERHRRLNPTIDDAEERG